MVTVYDKLGKQIIDDVSILIFGYCFADLDMKIESVTIVPFSPQYAH